MSLAYTRIHMRRGKHEHRQQYSALSGRLSHITKKTQHSLNLSYETDSETNRYHSNN